MWRRAAKAPALPGAPRLLAVQDSILSVWVLGMKEGAMRLKRSDGVDEEACGC